MRTPGIASAARANLLEISDIALRFGGIVALDGVSFSIEPGQILGLIGPNGAGKTTLFNCVSRLYTPNRGDIRFEGQSMLGRSPHRIAELGIGRTFQNLALFPTQSVLDNVRIGGHAHTRGDFVSDTLRLPWVRRQERALTETAWSLLRLLGLEGVAMRPAAGLPLGTRKRVELARALAGSPKLLMLDEPAGGLTHGEVGELGDTDSHGARRAAGHGAAGRASHEFGHVGVRQGRGARFRPQDRRGHPGRGAAGRRGDPRLSRHRQERESWQERGWPMMLEVDGLDAFYGQNQALYRIGFSLDEGQVRTLLGANGAGKTTVLRALSGMVRIAGDIRFDGRRISGWATEDIVRLGVAHVPEGRGTFLRMTVEENLQLGAMTRRDRPGIAADIERIYGNFPRLKERRTQQAGTLSGGEQQMLAVGRALMLRPRLLLLDEPSFGLAPLIVEELFAILGRVNAETGVAMLIVEQNAALALELAEHAYLLETGHIVMDAPAAVIGADESIRRSYLGY